MATARRKATKVRRKPAAAGAPSPKRSRRVRRSGKEAQFHFEAIAIEGGLLSPDWLARAAQLEAGGQSEADYRISKGLNLRDEISRYWRIAQTLWNEFAAHRLPTDRQRAAGREIVGDDDKAVTLSARFVTTLLRDCLGFGSLATVETAELGSRLYPIGHAVLEGRVPVVIAPAGAGLDTLWLAFSDGTRRRSAFGLCQEFLNAEDGALWGLASDGMTLRILRDNASLTRPAWIEADLARLFTEERYADFAALWLLAHETRFGRPGQPVTECSLETWRAAGRQEGTRAREQLLHGVEAGLVALGHGFLAHAQNQALRSALSSGALTKEAYFQELLRLAYRLIFLLTAEERGVLHPSDSDEAARKLYADGYGLRHLRERAVKRSAHDRHHDHWETVKIVFRGLASGEPRLGLPALAGIFAEDQCPSLDAARLENRSMLLALFRLSWVREDAGLARINWRDMGSEELGSVYESLLELVPQITESGRSFSFASGTETKGNVRRTTGSYYTPDTLVQALLDSALDPVLHQAIAEHPSAPVEALLALAVVDPACGSGHFLLAAARRLAAHVARLQTNGTPSATEYRRALRQVIGRCIHGVDLNPMAVELCKVSLWMEAVEPGMPLTFLDSHICHGNALLGTTPELMEEGIPNHAWKPIDGDDKKVSNALRKRNKEAARGQRDLNTPRSESAPSESDELRKAIAAVEAAPDADALALAQKESRWRELRDSKIYQHQKFVADAWCAAFMWNKQQGPLAEAAPTNELWRQLRDAEGQAPELTVRTVNDLAQKYTFFHWHLAFPQVLAQGGFDVVLGNPPWIAHAGRAAQPLPPAVKSFYLANYESFADYPTTHGVFVGLMPRILRTGGRLGFIIPSSLSELGGYAPTRRAHDRLCEFTAELVDFGEGRFPGVTQPCMALTSRRAEAGRSDAAFGEPWPMERPDLSPVDRQLLLRLAAMPTVPAELFGERGVQSDKALADHFLESGVPTARFSCPIREGTDVREFELLPPRNHVDRVALGGRIRSPKEFLLVRVLVRQTARYPIAAVSDGLAFRNSLLAGLDVPEWPPAAVVALLNSALIRWAHYMRFRDARQPVMPQVKIGHLRAIPIPLCGFVDRIHELATLGRRMTEHLGEPEGAALRGELDRLISELFELTPDEEVAVASWHGRIGPRSGVSDRSEALSRVSADVGRQMRGRPPKEGS